MRYAICLMLVASLIAAFSAAASAANLVSNDGWALARPADSKAMMEKVAITGLPGLNEAIRIKIDRPYEPFYTLQFVQNVAPAIPEGHRMRLTFWARSATRNPMRAALEKNGPPYSAIAEITRPLTPAWQRFTIRGEAPGYGANGIGARFQIGQRAGEVEVAGIMVEDLGLDSARASAPAAITQQAIDARIRKYRTGDLHVVVLDAKGRPVPGAKVKVEQTRHAFLFGCNIFGLQPNSSDPIQKEYQRRFAALFNYATLPFYWGSFEPEQGKPEYERLDAMARWCAAHNITTKGHPLIWHEVFPKWAPNDPDAAIPLLRQRVFDIVQHEKGLVHYWDVLNEANAAPNYANGEGKWIVRDGAAKVVATALGWAREAGKGAGDTFIYNDYDTGDGNVKLLTDLKKMNALPDVIGIQSHMHGAPWKLEQVWAVAERFAQFARPIHFTETTVVSGPPRSIDMQNPPTDWVTTPEDEEKQANYVERFYSILFSHPALRAITWWDFSDAGAWLHAPAGFLRKDMTPKPVYDRLMALIHGRWWTTTDGVTDRSGAYRTRAFYGDYRVSATDARGRTTTAAVTFPMGAGSKTVQVRLR